MNLFLFLFSYIMTLSGFFLGKSTKEEHEEIKKYVRYCIFSLIIIYYIIFFYFLSIKIISSLIIVLSIVLFFTFLYSIKKNKEELLIIHNLVLFSYSFVILEKLEYIAYVLLLVFAIFFQKSLREFDIKEEIYSFSILIILILFFYLIISESLSISFGF
jgi:lysylphosphatidylglycerol synthetase-like protein (DUF2156 family)